jgi:1-aminocyclopropane-1-carboxylate deaminase/D-cysteine desulfhydrase-like pyridoxal-dependent ACC family enzyme
VPSATGGTQAGLLAGLRFGGSAARVHGVAVAHPGASLRPSIEAVLGELVRRSGQVVDPADIELDETQLGSGYGARTPAANAATALLATTEGILVDPIYTAKALAALIVAARDGRLDGRTVVFWHAGGTPGLFESLEG